MYRLYADYVRTIISSISWTIYIQKQLAISHLLDIINMIIDLLINYMTEITNELNK